METEVLKIFNKDRSYLGVATRAEVHKIGHWHETFHCWFLDFYEEQVNIYFQIRSETKKDYPNLLDITAAGHILSHEEITDGVREIEEELGLSITYDELIPLGIIDYQAVHNDLIDNELANVFLYQFSGEFDQFNVQLDEVSGIVKADFNEFINFWYKGKDSIRTQGFEIIGGKREEINKRVSRASFVQHGETYYNDVLELIQDYINKRSHPRNKMS